MHTSYLIFIVSLAMVSFIHRINFLRLSHAYEEQHVLNDILADYDRRVLPTRDGEKLRIIGISNYSGMEIVVMAENCGFIKSKSN